MARQDETIEIFGTIEAESAKALLVNEGAKKVWIPKSLIANLQDCDGKLKQSVYIEVPEWFAMKEKLI